MVKKDKIIAIDLGGTTVKLGIVSNKGEILQKWSIQTNILNNGREIVPDIIESIGEHFALYSLGESDFVGIGMGSPGTVNHIEETVTDAYNLNWIETQRVGEQFRMEFDLPFFLDNDANLAALGEQRYGTGRNDQNIVMLTLGTGVGGGLIIDGVIRHGEFGFAGEIGHITIDKNSNIHCSCGKKGCLEALSSATGLVNLARQYSEQFSGNSEMKRKIDSGEEITSKEIFDSAKEGDLFSNHVVNEFSEYLGLACSHLANILNPSKIILGGGVAQAGVYLQKLVQFYFDKHVFPALKGQTKVALASLGNDAALLGAAELVNKGLQ